MFKLSPEGTKRQMWDGEQIGKEAKFTACAETWTYMSTFWKFSVGKKFHMTGVYSKGGVYKRKTVSQTPTIYRTPPGYQLFCCN